MDRRSFLRALARTALDGAVAAPIAAGLLSSHSSTPTTTESVYDRVLRTGTLRCGYTPYSVGLQKDPNTGVLSGIYYDIVRQLTDNLSLKFECVEEVGWGEQVAGLQAGRFDLVCSPVSLNAARARSADFSIPLYYSPVKVWAKERKWAAAANENFDRPDVKISVIDGEQTSAFARNYFSHAHTVSLPQSAPFADLLMQVTTGKADITFAEPLAVREFEATNGMRLVDLGDKPLLVVPNILLLKRDEFAFKQMIDNGLRELFNTGFIDKAISRYETYPNSYIRETTRR